MQSPGLDPTTTTKKKKKKGLADSFKHLNENSQNS
jgi:hypothetical protein